MCWVGDLASTILYSTRVHGGNGCLNLYTPTSNPSHPELMHTIVANILTNEQIEDMKIDFNININYTEGTGVQYR